MQYAIPCIISMLLTAAISLVDGYFIGNYIGKEGIVDVNFGLPLLYVYLEIRIMIGIGQEMSPLASFVHGAKAHDISKKLCIDATIFSFLAVN